MSTTTITDTTIKDEVRARYASAVTARLQTIGSSDCCAPIAASSCCGPTTASDCCGPTATASELTANARNLGYSTTELGALPTSVGAASFGCGNPTALIDLHPGETVLDLGSGAGLDVLLSARRVGPTGRAIGLDMTDEMLATARQHAAQAGATNVEFLKGEIEAIPLPDSSVDVIISNCVINLSPDKSAVLCEAYRVLRPGGRFAVSDIVAQGAPIPAALRADMASWSGCASGALHDTDYRAKLQAAGFGNVEIVVTSPLDSLATIDSACCGSSAVDDSCCGSSGGCGATDYEGGRFVSAFVRATKP